jgi:hypothetical protein
MTGIWALVGSLLLWQQAPPSETRQAWSYDARTAAWVPDPPRDAASRADSDIVWLGADDSSGLLVAVRDLEGRLTLFRWTPDSTQPTVLAALPEGPSEVRCVLIEGDRLWVGTEVGLYVRVDAQWKSYGEVGFMRRQPGVGTLGGSWTAEHGKLTDVFAVWQLEEGVVGIAARGRPRVQDEGGVFRSPLSSRPPRGAELKQLLSGSDCPEVAARDGEGMLYCLIRSLVLLRVRADYVEGLVDVRHAHIIDPATGKRTVWLPPDTAPVLLFFDREEAIWAAVSGPEGNLLLRYEHDAWMVNAEATELLAQAGRLFVTKDSDDFVYLGTERGGLFTFDGFRWKPSHFTAALRAWFEGRTPPALRPVWTPDSTLWLAAGNLLLRLDCPSG